MCKFKESGCCKVLGMNDSTSDVCISANVFVIKQHQLTSCGKTHTKKKHKTKHMLAVETNFGLNCTLAEHFRNEHLIWPCNTPESVFTYVCVCMKMCLQACCWICVCSCLDMRTRKWTQSVHVATFLVQLLVQPLEALCFNFFFSTLTWIFGEMQNKWSLAS